MAIRRELFPGEVLYHQGEPSDCAWLVEQGIVELTSLQGRRSTSLGLFGQGELIGELGMLDGGPRTATATAREHCVVLAIEHDPFLERLQDGDPIVRTLVDSMLRRIRGLLARMPHDAELPGEDVPMETPAQRAGIGKIRLEALLREALQDGSLEVRYQPIQP